MSPRDEEELDRQLREIRFEPRPSLGAEIRGRAERGEEPLEFPAWRKRSVVLGSAAAIATIGALVAGFLTFRPPASLTVDRCCQDLDGGGDADDGIVVVSSRGVSVQVLKIYEDLDRSGGYTPGDPVRFLRQGAPIVTGPIEGTKTTEFCCLDYDGGGPSDDALVIMGLPPDHITMAAIYERRSAGLPVELR
jgi:hypothetical protein